MNFPAPRTAVSFLLLLAAALFSSYLLSSFDSKKEKKSRPELGLVYYLNDAVLKGTGKDGTMLFRIETEQAARSEEDEYIDLKRVRLDYGPPKALPWKVKAFSGRITPNGNFILLRGNVIARSKSKGSDPIVIKSPAMNVETKTLIARAPGDVTLTLGDRVVTATGMEANFETNDLKLLSNVNGSFLP